MGVPVWPIEPAHDEEEECLKNNFHLKALVISRSATALLSFLFCLLVLLFSVVRFCRKSSKYDINERLMIYLMIPSSLYSLSVVFQYIAYYDYSNASYVIGCQVVGFFSLMFNWMMMIITFCIILHLLVMYFCRPNCLERSNENASKWLKKLDMFYLLLTLLGPLLFIFWPFINNYYGKDGTWCFIKSHPVNCTTSLTGIMEQLFVWYVWKAALSIILFFSLVAILSLLVCKKAIRKDKKRFRTLIALTGYLILHLASTGIAIVVRIVIWSYDSYILPLGILYSVLDPCQGLSAGIAVLIYLCHVICSKAKVGERQSLLADTT